MSDIDGYAPAEGCECEIDRLCRDINELEAQLDALAELAVDMARDLEDAPKGAWYAKRLRALMESVDKLREWANICTYQQFSGIIWLFG